jgi:hypothetical protein
MAPALAQCPASLPMKVRQDKLYYFLMGYWQDKPDTLAGKDFHIEKHTYMLRVAHKDKNPVYDTIEAQLNQIIFCDGRPAEAYFAHRKSLIHFKVLQDLLRETSSAEPIDSLYYLYDISTWQEFEGKFILAGKSRSKAEIDTVALEEVYRFRKDWFVKYGPELLEKSALPREEKELVGEYLCKMRLCEYLEKLEDSTAPQFR